jgi:hypothetical protein
MDTRQPQKENDKIVLYKDGNKRLLPDWADVSYYLKKGFAIALEKLADEIKEKIDEKVEDKKPRKGKTNND